MTASTQETGQPNWALGLALVGLVVVVASLFAWREIADAFAPAPVAVDLNTLERSFDSNVQSALSEWAGRPLIVSATVAENRGSRLALQSVWFAPVIAEMNSSYSLVKAGEDVKLRCRTLEEGGPIGGKPHLVGCDVAKFR